ncbi:MAG: PEP-CTERM sorting domain-containing protein [Fimbriimonadaceae bacterium]|nr:PEP-CTERM sorting domain-containing protein [Fimbriimonadaceae bacterium]
MKKLLLFAGIGAIATSSQAAVLIDNFITAQSLTITGQGVLLNNRVATGANTLGGTRQLYGINDVNPHGLVTQVDLGSGFGFIASGPRVDARVELSYGFTVAGALADLNADLTAGGNDRFRFAFDSNDQDVTVNIFLTSSTGTGGNTPLAFTQVVAGGRPTTAFTEDILFSSILINAASLADVDQIYIQFDTAPAGDVALTRLEAVPEPATMAVLASGALALLRRRRRA